MGQAQVLSFFPVAVKIHNPESFPLSVLTWGTPLDKRAALLGVFQIRDIGTGQTVLSDAIKISRKLPPLTEDLVEIPPGGAVDRVVHLLGQSFERGHQNSIRAQGTWQGIWNEPLASITASQLMHYTGATYGGFQSNVIVVKVD